MAHRPPTVQHFEYGSTVRLDNSIIDGNNLKIYGNQNTIRASFSTIEGHGNLIEATNVTVTGENNTIRSSYSTVTGDSNSVEGTSITVKGNYNTTDGTYGTITGHHNTITGHHTTAKGNRNRLDGEYCSATGDYNVVNGAHSSATGRHNQVTGPEASANVGGENMVNGVPAEHERERLRTDLQNQINDLMQRRDQLTISEQLTLHDLQVKMLDLQQADRREQHRLDLEQLTRGSTGDFVRQFEVMSAFHQLEHAHQLQRLEFMQSRNALVQLQLEENLRRVRLPNFDGFLQNVSRSRAATGPKIVLNLRGEDAEWDEDTDLIGAKCLCCWSNQANVAATCCGKLIACIACTKTLYKGKRVSSTTKCLSCQAAIEECVRIHF